MSTTLSPSAISKATLRPYLIALGILYLAVVVYLVLEKSPRYWGIALGLPIGIAIVTQPRLAVYQFLFCLLTDWLVIPEPTIFLIDFSAGLLVLAGLFDYLLADSTPKERPPLTFNYLFLLAALFIAGVFGFNPPVAFFPIARVTLFLAVFLALVRLSSRVPYAEAFRAFFVLMIAHALIALGPAIASGGKVRSLGLAGTTFDDAAMLIIPCGLAVYLWTVGTARRWYLLGTLVIFAGLIGTQTRFAILVCLILCVAVILVSLWRVRLIQREGIPNTAAPTVKKRIALLLSALGLLTSLFLLLEPSILERTYARFDAAASLVPGGTMLLRLTLWKAALTVFADHPFTGIGPGLFRTVDQYYGSLMFGPTHIYVRGLSAHNLFLHYLAESGLIGAMALLAFFGNQFRLARRVWRATTSADQLPLQAGLVVVSFGILLTTFSEGSWLWSSTGFLATFFIAAIASSYRSMTTR